MMMEEVQVQGADKCFQPSHAGVCIMKQDELLTIAAMLSQVGDARAADICTAAQARVVCPGGKLNLKLRVKQPKATTAAPAQSRARS